ncbi:MAG: NurA domain-containing protein [Chitinophagales bacterium]|nr:NurA domain-containing protein [Chitinophagales bacterium]
MSYSKTGNRPFEVASKSNHIHIIKDPEVQNFLNQHELPKEGDEISLIENYLINIDFSVKDSIEFIIAVDGGDTTVPVKSNFPSSTITFFQFGANLLAISDLKELSEQPFISPESISKLKELQRIKFTLPTKNIGLKNELGQKETLSFSVRKAIFDFFKRHDYLSTLKWFLFEEYKSTPRNERELASHPLNSSTKNVKIERTKINSHFIVSHSDGDLFLTDIFRLHEVVDEDLGAGGIVGYLRNLIEHFILIDTIKGLYKRRKNSLQEVLFIKDGPLGFFGQTANMHEPMRELINHLETELNIFLVGIEKSGPFVEHAQEIKDRIKPGQVYLLSNKHIYKYIKPGNPDSTDAYGITSYYSSKVIFKSRDEKIYVATLPTKTGTEVLNPQKENFTNIDIIMKHIENLKSDLYDNSLLPIALANKLVSLSDHPSSVLLEKFAKKFIT